MSSELDDDPESLYGLYAAEVRYDFSPDKYSDSPALGDPEYDGVLASEIKGYFPELAGWEPSALANAWRAYSRDVGLMDEELVCVRTPVFLGYLYVVQEGWPVEAGQWVVAAENAVKILWPDVVEGTKTEG